MRIFLDANVLFSAARSDGPVRRLLRLALESGHWLVADDYVFVEAIRNTEVKSPLSAMDDLLLLASVLDMNRPRPRSAHRVDLDWLPPKDRPVLEAAIARRCDVLVTGDRRHFAAGYGQTFQGVWVCSPAILAERLLGAGPT